MRFRTAFLTALVVSSPALLAQQPALPPASPPASAQRTEDPNITAANEAFRAEDWAAAAKSFEAALAGGVNTPLVHFRLGYSLHMLKRYDEALKHHLLATRIGNRALRIDALYNVCCAQSLLGNKGEALRYLQYAIDAGFTDKSQLEKDTDVDSLRGDDAFKKLVDGIGTTPRLDQQLDAVLGTWSRMNDKGEVAQARSFTRPLTGSQAIVTTDSTSGGAMRTGLLVPNALDRTWTWTAADGMGSTLVMTGKQTDGGFQFEGRETSIGGDGVRVRVTLISGSDGITEKAEVSDDGARWTPHHEQMFKKQ